MVKLSQALNKLIEEAIGNANKSLDERESKLLCRGKPTDKPSDSSSSDPSVQPCCKKQDAEIEKAKNELKTKQSESTQSEDSKKKEIAALKSQIKKAEDAKNDCAKTHYLPEEERQKGLEEVRQQREIVEKLKKFAEELDKTNNNNILTHLCSGLETFLGFNPDSKGYDGSGIVYSDLDRLCDGVMGFLLSIITDVKKDTNLTIYNGNLQTILNSIELAKYNRKTHFDSSIAFVSQGIREWVRGVEGKNKAVTRPLEYLQLRIKGHLTASMEDKPVTEQLENWQGIAGDYVGDLLDLESALDGIDENLKNKLSPGMELVKMVVENFEATVNDESVKRTVGAVKAKLADLPQNVNQGIEKNIQELHVSLNGNFAEIGRNISSLRHDKDYHVGAIKRAIRTAEQLGEKLVGDKGDNGFENYKKGFGLKFANIKTEIEKFTDNSTPLSAEFEKLKSGVAGLEENVRHGLESLKNKIETLADTVHSEPIKNILVQKAFEKLQKQKSRLDAAYLAASGPSNNLKTTYHLTFKPKFNTLTRQATDVSMGNVKIQLSRLAERIEEQLATLKNIHTTVKNSVNAEFKNLKDGKLKSHVDLLYVEINKVVNAYVEELKNALQAGVNAATNYPSNGSHDGLDKLIATLKSSGNQLQTLIQQAKLQSSNKVVHYLEICLKSLHEANAQWKTHPLSKSSELLESMKSAISEQINMKIEAAKSTQLEDLLEAAAKKGTEDYAENLRKNINGEGVAMNNVGIYGKIDIEIKRIKNPLNDQSPDDFQIQFKDFEAKLTELRSSSKTAKSTEADVQSKLDALIAAVDNLNDSISMFDEEARDRIKDAADTAIEEAVKCFNTQSSNDTIDVKTIMEQFEEANTSLTTAVSLIGKQLDLLNQLPAYVTSKSGEADETMDNLKAEITKIQKAIEHIMPLVESAEKAFNKVIDTLESSVSSTRSFVKFALPALQTHLQKQVTQAFADLEYNVQEMFDAQKKSELKMVQKCVGTQIPMLQKIIDDDAKAGLKGLMKTFTVITTLLHTSGTSFDAYSNRVKNFFANFLAALSHLTDLSPDRLTPLADALSALLSTMNTQRHFHADVSSRLAELQSALDTLTPSSFADASPLLNVVKAGVRAFHGELAKQYVSRYSGKTIEWLKNVEGSKTGENEPTGEALKCGKVFFSCLQMLFDGLHELRQNCSSKAAWEHKTISLTEAAQHGNTITNPLGRFFQRCGYTVCSGPNKHNGELRNTVKCRGGHIHKKLDAEIPTQGTTKYKLVTKEDLDDAVLHRQPQTDDAASAKQYGILKQLVDHLHAYYSVCHLPHFAARKYPCTVFDMLKWLCGLTSSTVYNDLTLNGFDVLFEKDKKETEAAATTGDIPIIDEKPASLSAYPYDVTTRQLRDVLIDVCHYSQDVLTCLLGNGHADGIYACEFNTNYDGFMYPGNMDTLLCMLREIVNRVYLQLHFLFQQCQYGTSLSGWLECEYGRDVGGSSWRCNTNQCADQTCKQIADQKRNQNCKLHPKCGVKSPLQSFLEDGLQGFLPHQIKYEKGKLECNVKSHAGIQCITPMGFADISHVASVTQTGHRIADVLAGFCGNQMSPLAKMCSLLNCAILSAPKTLGEMFGFYYGFLNRWEQQDKNRKEHREDAYRNAVQDANFGDSSTELDISPLFESTAHTGTSTTHVKGDLFMLVKCNGEKAALDPVGTCGSYLQPLCGDICNMYSKEHADKYLSWIVYLTETFYDLLSKLLDDCKSRCGSPKSRCQQQTCVKNCRAVVSTTESPALNHDEACKSIVQCQSSLPNLFKYGFYYGSASDLSGSYNNATKRSCKDLCKALERVLNKEENRGHVLADLVFKKLPDFLFTIRQPFIWLNVALWSLSLFYLICVMVGRLDVLHIRSHLRVPSSHKITAQSLLAAAQVGRLAKISYLQP
ncbi:hypothetical protein, conserved [Babesia bigemina]|uniref:C3H1-type domain-containing protein n=1 Tax=Babesia bigemina TaxID=5866 RepID=A0A061BRB0_BABBI|nr:hypothetical protein, conserved [Babesia bigemina]CDR71978.1 hypothetical protein, conserved [Babesia bigemina]|eukprot:XP_012770919.1 hypothetical protein, conserved [Babesia bigemina]